MSPGRRPRPAHTLRRRRVRRGWAQHHWGNGRARPRDRPPGPLDPWTPGPRKRTTHPDHQACEHGMAVTDPAHADGLQPNLANPDAAGHTRAVGLPDKGVSGSHGCSGSTGVGEAVGVGVFCRSPFWWLGPRPTSGICGPDPHGAVSSGDTAVAASLPLGSSRLSYTWPVAVVMAGCDRDAGRRPWLAGWRLSRGAHHTVLVLYYLQPLPGSAGRIVQAAGKEDHVDARK